MKSARGIHKHHIVSVLFRVDKSFSCCFYRVLRASFKDLNSCLTAHDFQLVDSGGTVNITRYEQGVFALLFIHTGELCTMGGLTASLQTAHKHYRGRCGGNGKLGIASAHNSHKLFVYYFYYLLCGNKALHNVCAHSTLGHLRNKFLNDLEVYVRFQQRQLYLTHARLYVGFGESALVAELLQSTRHFIYKTLKHIILPAGIRQPNGFRKNL